MKKLLTLLLVLSGISAQAQKAIDSVKWQQQVLIQNQPVFEDAQPAGTRGRHAGHYGSQYCRLLKLKDGSWLAGYTVSVNNGYRADPKGGLWLQFSKSTNDCKTWTILSGIADPGRDLDNAMLIQAPNGDVLLACRSVRWQESYLLPVYKSADKGKTWQRISIIDQNEGKPGELGNPDKGIYEPHFYFLDDGRLAVMYANEKHVVENPSYSQIISERVSPDMGKTWGDEIFVAHNPDDPKSRPGMPVWTKMKNGKYIAVYEVCGPQGCNIYHKTSDNGTDWPAGIGTRIMDQLGGPFILALKNGDLVVTSNSAHVSVSHDFGATWKTINSAWAKTLWPSLYEISKNQIGAVNSAIRPEGGNNVQVRLGKVVY